MNEDAEALPTLNIKEIFGQAFSIYRSNIQIFLAIGLLYGFANVAASLLAGRVPQSLNGAVFLANIFITCIASVLVISSMIQLQQRRVFLLKNNLRFLQRFYFTFVAVSLSQMLLAAAGVMFFIIPGIYCLVVFIFADILAVVEKKKYLECFQESVNLTHGFFWPILFFLVMLGCFSFLPAVLMELLMPLSAKLANSVNTAATVFIAPFLMISQMQLYLRMKQLRKS
jgi:hypothetical protein